MSLRKKIALILLGVGAFYTLTDGILQNLYIPGWFETWEIEDAQRSLARVQTSIEEDQDALTAKAKIWAHSDALFRFVTGAEDSYGAYLDSRGFEASDVDLFFVCDGDGQVLWKRALGPDTREPISVRDSIPGGALHPAHPLRRFKSGAPVRTGMMMTAHGPLLVTAFAVPDAAGRSLAENGPVQGWQFPRHGVVILGRFLGQGRRDEIATDARASIRIFSQDEVELDEDKRALVDNLTSGDAWAWEVADDERLEIYTSFEDIQNGDPLILEAVIEREITARGERIRFLAQLSTLAGALILVLVTYRLLQRIVIRPLTTLTKKAVEIGRTDNTKIRVGMERDDELGQLAGEFDDMLEKLAISRAEVVHTARLAGMSQIASGVLHNVGNVLNSVNVSATMVSKKTEKLPVGDLEMMAEVLREHQDDLGEFVTQDPKGKHLLPFLLEVTGSLSSQRAALLEEMRSLNTGIEHIADLVRAQQSYAGTKGVFEYASLEEEVESAIRFCEQAMVDSGKFELVRDFEDLDDLKVDKHKLMEILVNLLQNARQALDEGDSPDKRLTVRILHVEGDKARIEIEDTGIGIPEGDLARVFQHGFTTKKDGHGFGLHVSANAATEMNAKLQARSDGPGRGATFYLDIPIERAELASAA